MKKIISLISLLALLGVLAPVLAQDAEPPTTTPVDCNTLKGKEKNDCKKAEKEKKAKKDKKGK